MKPYSEKSMNIFRKRSMNAEREIREELRVKMLDRLLAQAAGLKSKNQKEGGGHGKR